MSYLEDLIENGTGFKVQRSPGTVSLTPVSRSDADLVSFQSVVRNLQRHEGEGYTIFKDHKTSDRGEDLFDLIILAKSG